MRKIILFLLAILFLAGCADKPEDKTRKDARVVKSAHEKQVETDSAIYALFRKVNPDTLIITKDELENLIADIYFIYFPNGANTGGPKSIEVKNYYFAPDQSWQSFQSFVHTKLRLHEHYSNEQTSRTVFRPAQIYPLPGDTSLLVSFYDTGFESIAYVFAVFNKKGDDLILQTFLDTIYTAGMGNVTIDTVIPMTANSYLIAGNGGGGDEGDVWKTVWYAKWDKPNLVTNIYKKDYDYYFEENEKKFERTLDAVHGQAVIKLLERKVLEFGRRETKYSEWNTVDVDTLNYAPLF